MPDAAKTLLRPLCAITATLVLASAAPGAGAAASGGFTAPDDPAVPALISSLRGCVDQLAAADRRVLALRAGLGGHAPQSTAQVAAALGVAPAAASAAEVGAIRKLEAVRRRGACQVQAAGAPAASAPAPAPATQAQAKPAAPRTTARTAKSSGASTTSLLEVAVPALLVLAFIAGIWLETHRRPRGR